MNASLRLAGGAKLPGWMTEHLEGNRYVNTIYLCASGMLKFSAVSRIPKGRKVYRGIAGVRLPGLFVLVGVDGSRGGVEFAFMSTTHEKQVAIGYAMGPNGENGPKEPMVYQVRITNSADAQLPKLRTLRHPMSTTFIR